MHILHTSDLHLTRGRRRRLLKFDEPFDLWLDTGDFLPSCGRVQRTGFRIDPDEERFFQRRWASLSNLGNRLATWLDGRPCVYVPGNHCFVTLGDILREVGYPELYEITPEGVEVLGLRFAGFRQVPRMIGEWMGEASPSMFYDPLMGAVRAGADILATHAPAAGVLSVDEDGLERGVPRLYETLEKLEQVPRWHFFGHVHHTAGQTAEVLEGRMEAVNGAEGMKVWEVDRRG